MTFYSRARKKTNFDPTYNWFGWVERKQRRVWLKKKELQIWANKKITSKRKDELKIPHKSHLKPQNANKNFCLCFGEKTQEFPKNKTAEELK